MSVAAGRFQLANAFKAFKQEWEGTSNVWRDQVRKDCAELFIDPLDTRMASLLTAMDRLDQTLAQMKQDCGEEGN